LGQLDDMSGSVVMGPAIRHGFQRLMFEEPSRQYSVDAGSESKASVVVAGAGCGFHVEAIAEPDNDVAESFLCQLTQTNPA
jgi:hypothetical protein